MNIPTGFSSVVVAILNDIVLGYQVGSVLCSGKVRYEGRSRLAMMMKNACGTFGGAAMRGVEVWWIRFDVLSATRLITLPP